VIVEIEGKLIRSEADFHAAIARSLELPSHYGNNLDALWDTLSADMKRPLRLTWKNASSSQGEMPDCFEKIVGVLRKVERQDVEWRLPAEERFELVLR
jgi:ribonuclease inhibitor